ncbi:MAG: signal peptide peptidase SppA [Deltaproteobacteria bacterium]|uniref:Signal peptide peptidase SppA n=1 Tax=Candidatus Zymogenus saltonus TaxID=2844893 RepID=A0A9D8PNU0_9DELT|nr:signal peptide peptidase SppA [Candidatus Zymogenus saltonus]
MVKRKGIIIAVVIAVSLVMIVGIYSLSLYMVMGIKPFSKSVGVIEVKGVIYESGDVIKNIKDFRDREDIAAVVLRVDSPGGGVAAAQEIYEEIKKLASEKVVVTSMGGVAASAGYYISLGSSYIFANPGTTTGSIGVIVQGMEFHDALDSLGIKGFVIKSGKFKDTGSPFREMTAEERQYLQDYIDNIFQQFVNVVVKERKLPKEKVLEIADGRILSGEQALKLKLIDELGNMEDAVKKAAEMAGIEGEPRLVYPPKEKISLLSILLNDMKTGLADVIFDRLMENRIRVEYRLVP